MKTIQYREMDKSNWSDGPWQNEPDKIQFEYKNFPCLIVRNRFGALCGYVGVEENHWAFKKGWDDLNLNVHGGITFTDFCQNGDECSSICHKVEQEENDCVWWIGFDCAHGGDYYPEMSRAISIIEKFGEFSEYGFSRLGTYKDMEYVKHEIYELVEQLIINN